MCNLLVFLKAYSGYLYTLYNIEACEWPLKDNYLKDSATMAVQLSLQEAWTGFTAEDIDLYKIAFQITHLKNSLHILYAILLCLGVWYFAP